MATPIGSSGFWAQVDLNDPTRPIFRVGYSPGATVHSPEGLQVIQANPVLMQDPPNGLGNNAIEAFLNTLYGVGANLYGDDKIFDLSDKMEEAGILDQFDKIQIVDFMALTEAIERYQVLPNGEQVDTLSFQPSQKRPGLQGLKRKDNVLMMAVIKHLGLWAFAPYLWSVGGIDFDEFDYCIKQWKPDKADRTKYFTETLMPLLRVKLKARMFRPEELTKLLE